MANTTSIREQLTFKAGLQIFLVIVSIVFTVLYTLPKIEEIGAQAERTNAAVDKYNDLHDNGISFWSLTATVQRVGDNKALIELISRSGTGVQDVIKKTTSEPYLTWLTNSLGQSDADRAKLADSRARINSIIPTLSPVSNNVDENSVTLRDYITFMEKDILSNFQITSLSPLGIDGVTYEQQGENTNAESNPIGKFSVELNFTGTNKNISELLNFLSILGKPDVFASEGILSNPPAIMSNPLITINSLSLTKSMDASRPNEMNTGRIALTFYVRGSSTADQDYLLETFNKRRSDLSAKINDSLKKCQETSCVSLTAIENVKMKFDQFDKSFQATLAAKKWNSVETIYMIGQQIQSLKYISDEFENIK